MLAIHILNVGHGDSIVLEYKEANEDAAYAVIDSNTISDGPPKALTKLQSLGATSLSFIALTHPHADHYSGMSQIMAAYAGNIERIYTFPLERAKLKKVAENISKVASGTDNISISKSALEFIEILSQCKQMAANWGADTSPVHRIGAPGFDNVEFSQILPPAKVKGKFFQDIEKGIVDFEAKNQNDLSLAFMLQYKGLQFVLGGDGTQENWLFQQPRWRDINFSLNPIAVKLPHHGSRTDSSSAVLDILYAGNEPNAPNIACISADGRSHPDKTVLDDVIRRGLKPYCTNLAVRCGAAHQDKIDTPNCEPELARFLSTIVTDVDGKKSQPCQGDITIRISDDGVVSVETEFNHPCPFRGDYENFLPSAVQ